VAVIAHNITSTIGGGRNARSGNHTCRCQGSSGSPVSWDRDIPAVGEPRPSFAPLPTVRCGTLPGLPSVIIEEIMRCSLSPLHCMPGISELGSREERCQKWPAMRWLARYIQHYYLRSQHHFIRNPRSLFLTFYPWKGKTRQAGLAAGCGSHLEPPGWPVPAFPSQRFLRGKCPIKHWNRPI